jgi:hypothetical protein
MGQNTALKITQLENILLSKSVIESAIAKREHIFELQQNEESLGFISLYDLKDYLAANEASDEVFYVRNIDQENFQNIYEHPLFQRRKLQIIEEIIAVKISPTEERFHILQLGQKAGPYTKAQIENFILKNEMIMNDMVSLNDGQTWQKVYSTEGFERRALKPSDELPRLPDEDFLKHGPANLRNSDDTTEATSSLAYLGNLKKGKIANFDYEQSDVKENKKINRIGNNYKWLFIISILGIGYFLYNIKSALVSPLGETPSAALGEHTEYLNPTDSNINGSSRQTDKFQTKQLNPVRPRANQQKSFRNSNPGSMQPQRGSTDPNYYYDNSAPMELDPVREQVSKETFENSNPGDPGPPPADDALFNQESSN